MNEAKGFYSDGIRLKAVPVILRFDDHGRMQVTGDGIASDVSVVDLTVSDRLAAIPRFLYLPNAIVIESLDNDIIDAVFARQGRGRAASVIHRLEQHSAFAASAAALLVVIVGLTVYFGLPRLARTLAYRVPPAVEENAGKVALAALFQRLPHSSLTPAERFRVQQQLDRLLPDKPPSDRPSLHYRSLGEQNPNAFALPGNQIVVSDEFVRLASHDEEIAAVLAHEIGHLELRHGIQSALRSSFALLFVAAVTGDLSTLTSFAGTLPFVILQNGYSREFEREADRFAHQLMIKRGIPLRRFSVILKKLQASQPTTGFDFSYLNTHPDTKERVSLFEVGDDLPIEQAKPKQAPTPSVPKKSIALPKRKTPKPTEAPSLKPFMTLNELGQNPGSTADAKRSSSTPPIEKEAVGVVVPNQGLQRQPVVIVQTRPEIPIAMNEITGRVAVLVTFIVDTEGNVREPEVVRSDHDGFNEVSLNAVRQWKFTPGEINFKPVNTRMQVPFVFQFEDNAPKTTSPK